MLKLHEQRTTYIIAQNALLVQYIFRILVISCAYNIAARLLRDYCETSARLLRDYCETIARLLRDYF